MATGYQIPTSTPSKDKQEAQGFGTPKQDKTTQVVNIVGRRVIPIIFIPGIMGSNLIITSKDRQKAARSYNDVSWRPDNKKREISNLIVMATPATRQLMLDPATTEVDVYVLGKDGDSRHDNVTIPKDFSSPLLVNDPPGTGSLTREQKARQRGWGEVFYSSYGNLLMLMESRLNNAFQDGKLNDKWKDVVGVDPKAWAPHPSLPQIALTENELKAAIDQTSFPVFAVGYNWLRSNGESALKVKKRIEQIIESYKKSNFDCEKVIVVTHSMGGMVGRALVNPDIGNFADKVLGIIHGAQPAIGAAAAYRRLRAGFEDPGFTSSIEGSGAAKAAGNYGSEVTAVLANAQGGLELLPNQAYGNNWLQILHKGKKLLTLPNRNDPYEEIYMLRGKWYSLIKEEWINPARLPADMSGWDETVKKIKRAKVFHTTITDTYHPISYAHYGTDPGRLAFGDVVWEIASKKDLPGFADLLIGWDSGQGRIALGTSKEIETAKAMKQMDDENMMAGEHSPPKELNLYLSTSAKILDPTEPGDQTVPQRSSNHQRRSGKFKGIFEQNGYEHQGSYANAAVLASTLYCIIKIVNQTSSKK